MVSVYRRGPLRALRYNGSRADVNIKTIPAVYEAFGRGDVGSTMDVNRFEPVSFAANDSEVHTLVHFTASRQRAQRSAVPRLTTVWRTTHVTPGAFGAPANSARPRSSCSRRSLDGPASARSSQRRTFNE